MIFGKMMRGARLNIAVDCAIICQRFIGSPHDDPDAALRRELARLARQMIFGPWRSGGGSAASRLSLCARREASRRAVGAVGRRREDPESTRTVAVVDTVRAGVDAWHRFQRDRARAGGPQSHAGVDAGAPAGADPMTRRRSHGPTPSPSAKSVGSGLARGRPLWPASLRRIDALLEDEAVLEPGAQALEARWPQSRRRGRPGTPAEVVLRMLGAQAPLSVEL